MDIKMEAFDMMHYLNGRSYEIFIHGLFRFSGRLDAEILKKAVTLSAEAAPVVFCTLSLEKGRPYWKKGGFSAEDIVKVVEAPDSEEKVPNSLFASSIDVEKEPQLKLILLRFKDSDALLAIMNHMITDGAGYKAYFYLLSRLYNQCLGEGEASLRPRPQPRDTGRLFKDFGLFEKIKILFSKYDRSALKLQKPLDLEGDRSRPVFASYQIGAEDIGRIKAYAKVRQASLNDMLFAAFARVVAERTGARRVALPCPADLRKYSPDSADSVANLTTNYIIDIDVEDGSPFEETLAQVSEQLKRQKRSAGSLKSVAAIELIFRIIPFPLLKLYFEKENTVPVLSFTNAGIIDKERLRFGETELAYAYASGAIKHAPFFQIVVSTFDGAVTLSCNQYASAKDEAYIISILKQVHMEMMDCLNNK